MNKKILRGMMLLGSACVLSAAVAAQQQQQPARARRGGLDNLSLPSTTARVASASTGAAVWQTFAPEGAGFSVSLPGLPEESTRGAGGASGQPAAQVRNYRLDFAGLKYEIGRTGQLPEQFVSQPDYMERFFAGASRGIAAALTQQHRTNGFKLVSEETISLGGYEGREYEFASEGHRAVARLFLIERSIYGLSVIGPKSEMTPARVERFLDSFAPAQ